MKTIKATHYICIKEPTAKDETLGKDKLILRAGENKEVNKAELKLLETQAKGRWVEVETVEGSDVK